MGSPFFTGGISPKKGIQNQKFKNEVIFEVVSMARCERNFANHFLFSVCNPTYGRLITFYSSYLVYSQIWLNLPTDGSHFFLHLAMDSRHFGCIQNFLEKH
jgi:hypothetical protein